MRKVGLAVLSCVMLVFFAAASWGMTFVTIGTGGVGGTYYPLGGAIAEVLTKADIGIKATSRAAGASQENCRLVGSGRIQMGMTMGITLYQAYMGTGAFVKDGKLPLRTLMQMYPAPHHLVTTTKTGIKTLADLKGKKVVLGAPGSGDMILSTLILAAAGLDVEKDINKQLLTMAESTTALKDGNIDAVFWNFPTPGAAYLEASAVRDLVLIPLPSDLVKEIVKQNPFLFPYTIKGGTYAKQDQDVLTVADGNFLIVNEKMEEDVAYRILKTIIDHREDFMKVTQQAAHFTSEGASIGVIPFCEGSKKYFLENGIRVD